MVKDLPILKIKIFDTNGKTLFSTDASQTGSIKPPDYPGSRVARTGGVISSISERDTFLGIDGSEVYNRTVLSSYLPIYGEQDKNIIGVFEIYSDITARLAEIDRSFITDIPEDKDDVSITIAIINMARGLGIKTVAEGVEMKEQLDFLKIHECNLMQGYYFSKPVAFDEIVTLLQQEQADSNPERFNSAI